MVNNSIYIALSCLHLQGLLRIRLGWIRMAIAISILLVVVRRVLPESVPAMSRSHEDEYFPLFQIYYIINYKNLNKHLIYL